MKCKNCNKKISEFARECPYCKRPVEVEHNCVEAYLHKVQLHEMQGMDKEKHKFSKKIKYIAAGMTGAAILAVMAVYKQQNTIFLTKDTVFYQKEDSLIARNVENDKETVIDRFVFDAMRYDEHDMVNKMVYHAEKQNKFYYIKDLSDNMDTGTSYAIYEKRSDSLSDKQTKVAENVSKHTWDEQGNLYYTINDDTKIYKYDGEHVSSTEVGNIGELKYVKKLNGLFISYSEYDVRDMYENFIDMDDLTSSQLDYEEESSCYEKIGVLDLENMTFTYEIEVPNGASYQISQDNTQIYLLNNGVLYKEDLKEHTKDVLQKDVSDYKVTYDGTIDVVYYIHYKIKEKNAYELYKDPYLEQDEKTAQNKSLLKKENDLNKARRLNRQSYRQKLKSTSVMLYGGELYKYELGKKSLISPDIAMFSDNLECNENTLPMVYKQKKLEQKPFVIQEEIENLDQEEVDPLGGYTHKYGSLDVITTLYVAGYDAIVSYYDEAYMVEKSKLQKYNDDSEILYFNSIRMAQKETYYVKSGVTNTLYKNDQQGHEEAVIDDVIEYQVLEDGRVLVLCEDADYQNNLYIIDKEGKKEEISGQVDRFFLDKNSVWKSQEAINDRATFKWLPPGINLSY